MARRRDHRAEYERRIARGLARGVSRGQARGHPPPGERGLRPRPLRSQPEERLEEGVRLMREGHSLAQAARVGHVGRDRLRRYVERMGIGLREGRRWRIGPDRRPRYVPLYTGGRVIEVLVPGYEEAALVGRYMSATGRFQVSNDPLLLAPFVGAYVRDVGGREYPFETAPNTLYRLMAAGPEPFEQIYRIVV